MALGEQLVRLANLVEAEGRLAKQAIFRLAMALAILAVVSLLLLAAFALLVGAAYVALRRVMPVDAALLTIGLAILILAISLFGWSKALSGDGD